MHTYRKGKGFYTIGVIVEGTKPDPTFIPLFDVTNRDYAIRAVSVLNGGNVPPLQQPLPFNIVREYEPPSSGG